MNYTDATAAAVSGFAITNDVRTGSTYIAQKPSNPSQLAVFNWDNSLAGDYVATAHDQSTTSWIKGGNRPPSD